MAKSVDVGFLGVGSWALVQAFVFVAYILPGIRNFLLSESSSLLFAVGFLIWVTGSGLVIWWWASKLYLPERLLINQAGLLHERTMCKFSKPRFFKADAISDLRWEYPGFHREIQMYKSEPLEFGCLLFEYEGTTEEVFFGIGFNQGRDVTTEIQRLTGIGELRRQ